MQLLVGGEIALSQHQPIVELWGVDRGRSILGPSRFLVALRQTMGILE